MGRWPRMQKSSSCEGSAFRIEFNNQGRGGRRRIERYESRLQPSHLTSGSATLARPPHFPISPSLPSPSTSHHITITSIHSPNPTPHKPLKHPTQLMYLVNTPPEDPAFNGPAPISGRLDLCPAATVAVAFPPRHRRAPVHTLEFNNQTMK